MLAEDITAEVGSEVVVLCLIILTTVVFVLAIRLVRLAVVALIELVSSDRSCADATQSRSTSNIAENRLHHG